MAYADKLKSPYWQKKRLLIMERDNWHCLICGSGDFTLAVHHKEYLPGREPWEYDDDNFLTLCEACHNLVHFTGNKSDLKAHLMERFHWDKEHSTLTLWGISYLFQLHHLRAN